MKNAEQSVFPVSDTINPLTAERCEPLTLGLTKREYAAIIAMRHMNYTLHPASFWDAVKLFMRRFGAKNTVHFTKPMDIKSDVKLCIEIADELLKQLEK